MIFHDVSDEQSPFTRGLNVSISRRRFENLLRIFSRHYTPLSLQEVIDMRACELPEMALLLTFDDAYASVADVALPLCQKYRVPFIFFVNAAFLDNRRIALQNLLAYARNISGMDAIEQAVRTVGHGLPIPPIQSVSDVSSRFLPALPTDRRQMFFEILARLAGLTNGHARQTALYLTTRQLREMAAAGVEIGNHTYSHAHCRALTPADFDGEINRNKAELESLTGRPVRAFSVPFGSSADLTPELVRYLRRSGHQAIFLSENTSNPQPMNLLRLDRVTTDGAGEYDVFRDVEVLPRLRSMRNRWLRRSGGRNRTA